MTKNRSLPASAIPSISMSENDFPIEITSFGYSGLTKRGSGGDRGHAGDAGKPRGLANGACACA